VSFASSGRVFVRLLIEVTIESRSAAADPSFAPPRLQAALAVVSARLRTGLTIPDLLPCGPPGSLVVALLIFPSAIIDALAAIVVLVVGRS
jgi:hypothetical protein